MGVGAPCEGVQSQHVSAEDRQGSRTQSRPDKSQQDEPEKLSAEEKKALFNKYVLQGANVAIKAKDVHHGVLQVMNATMPKMRYRHDEVVTRKGERRVHANS